VKTEIFESVRHQNKLVSNSVIEAENPMREQGSPALNEANTADVKAE
jgi:hypothetical protein